MAKVPVAAGVCQYTQAKDEAAPLDPMGLMVRVCKGALADAGVSAASVDGVFVVNVMSWAYQNPPGELAAALGAEPREVRYTPIGGNSPQLLVNEAARAIEEGACRAVLIAGAEAAGTIRRMQKGEVIPDWPEPAATEGSVYSWPEEAGSSGLEMLYDVFAPAFAYAYFENAMRAARGRNLSDHMAALGKISEDLARVAAQNPFAWVRDGFGAEEISSVSDRNRMVGYPYTLRMNANVHVDQAAALLLLADDLADGLGVPEEKRVYAMGGADLHNIWNVANRPTLHDAPALAEAARISLDQAGLSAGEIGFFDFYSCFPWAVEAARDALALDEDDPRPVTVTGGLPYFGGPGSNYTTHAIVNAVERIRKNPSEKGLVTALGWYNTKWSVGIYGRTRPENRFSDLDLAPAQAALLKEALPDPAERPEGRLTVETYVIVHDKTGAPQRGTVIGRMDDGQRAMAFLDADPAGLARLEGLELVGRSGGARFDAATGTNRVRLDIP